jgi:(E)-4-hydroxy-3-methylbut-2-enyl-diphosphate synthase
MELIDYPLKYQRHATRVVHIGHVAIGGDNPICIQSMLTAATGDVAGCLQEIRSLQEVGCGLIRLAIPARMDLERIPELRRVLQEEGINIPLIADIHYSPQLALDACELFEKIRINPGNYSDNPKSVNRQTDGNYFAEGHEKLKEAIQPLSEKLKKFGNSLRIGVNQGSLSSRMMERYGDSPQGMVQSALEMVALFEALDFFQIVVSLKSSNPITVQKAYRLLVAEGPETNAVPLHLGVTEAGNELMGRIKSLVGMGSLLTDGIGDTFRVSLTEPAANEVVFAKELIEAVNRSINAGEADKGSWCRPVDHLRMKNRLFTSSGVDIGSGSPLKIGKQSGSSLPKTEIAVEADFSFEVDGETVIIGNERFQAMSRRKLWWKEPISKNQSGIVLDSKLSLRELRAYYRHHEGKAESSAIGMIYPIDSDMADEIHVGAILSEGLLDFLLIPAEIEAEAMTRLLTLLQAARARILTTEYITCPSCARTLFDIESTVNSIKKQTRHLKGVKIGVMGCIVNGPGEMADADFGYVGSGKGKIDLYFGQDKVERGIDEKDAVEKLIGLIKEKGRWS